MAIDYKNGLNPEQYEAVSTTDGPLLIIAGAGSGKTRVITYRMVYMLEKGIPQSEILALTFTNKAAREMSERVRELSSKKLQNLTVSTFHAYGVKILRKEIGRLGWKENFSIYDEVDRSQLIRDSARETGFNMERFDANKAGVLFSDVKTGRATWGGETDAYRTVFDEYQASLKAFNSVDFDDLIGLPIEIFESWPEAREKWQSRYTMVDEFQDTSLQQYRLLRLIAGNNTCVVGDDDQSIYSWRGANYQNIVNFEKDWPQRKIITLYRNYRSTSTILDAANSVIKHNSERKPKDLESPREGGSPIQLLNAEDEIEEGRLIAGLVRELKFKEALRYEQFAILIRTNALARNLEEALLEANIPYRMSGGMSFFQRREIKDIISWMRVIANPDDDVNLIRIINVPRRGIGRRTLEVLGEISRRKKTSLHATIIAVIEGREAVPERAREDLRGFMDLLEGFREEFKGRKNLAKKTRKLVDSLDYWAYLVSDNPQNDKIAKWKYMNIDSLIKGIEVWENDPDNLEPGLYEWLNRISLISRDDEDEEDGKLNLMTIHAAKGLEFEIVFIAGCEEGIIPHARTLEEAGGNMEEERRLFYVAITRAREKLYMTVCKRRRRNAMPVDVSPSPFLEEIPQELVSWLEGDSELSEADTEDIWKQMNSIFSKK